MTRKKRQRELRPGEHRLTGHPATRNVFLDGHYLDPRLSQAVNNHSPDGFNWGYGGSGPNQLALAVVLALTGEKEGYHTFCDKVVSQIPKNDIFEIVFVMPDLEHPMIVSGLNGQDEADTEIEEEVDAPVP